MDRDTTLATLKHHLEVARNRMKKQANRKRREVILEVGDLVFLKLRPYRQKSVAQRRNEKLAARFFGPLPILERIGNVAYRVELSEGYSIHNVFHVSQLKKQVGESQVPTVDLPVFTEDFEWILQPETILGLRWNEMAKETKWLVHWQHHQ